MTAAHGLLRGAEEGDDHTDFGVWRALSVLMPEQVTDSILLGAHLQEKMLFLGKYRSCSLLKAESEPGEHSIVVFINTLTPSASASERREKPARTVPEGPFALQHSSQMLGFNPDACKYREKFIDLFAAMKFLIMAANHMKFETIPWLESQSALHEFSRAVKTESTNETVI